MKFIITSDFHNNVLQRMTFVQARIDDVRESFRGRQTSTRGRRRGRPRKRLNDDLDEWTPDRPRAVRGRRRGRPPSNLGRGRATISAAAAVPASPSLSPVRKAPRGRGRVANDRQRPGPKPKLEGPGPPPAVFTPGGKCFVCSKAAGSTGSTLAALSSTTKMPLHQKLGRVVGAELDLIVDEDGVLCQGCCRLLNYMDRIEVEHSMLTKSILNCMRRTFGFGYVQGDNKIPEAVLASIEDYSKKLPVEKLGINADTPEKATSAPGLQIKAVTSLTNSNDDKKKTKLPINEVPESKTDTQHDMKNYQCKICTFKSKHKSVFLFHLRQHLQSNYMCDFCNILLPKGYKLAEKKNTEKINNDVFVHKIESTEESVEISAPKEVKDYVETMIEELHTTGIVTTMKPATPDKQESSLDAKDSSSIEKECEDVVRQSEIGEVDIDYIQQPQSDVNQSTVNILLTFPSEKRQSISVPQDITVPEHHFSNDVACELRDIFGNFNDEPIDVDDESMPQKENVENLNISFVKTLPEHTLIESSPMIADSRDDEKTEDNNSESTSHIPDSATCTGNLEDQRENENIPCNDETEDKYHKQLALLDEMGLIMLPKRNRISLNKENIESEGTMVDDAEHESHMESWNNTGEIASSMVDDQNHDSQPTKDVELDVLKEQNDWLPGSLNHEETVSVASSNVEDVTSNNVHQQAEDGNGHEWFKASVSLVDENSHWLHHTDSNPNTNSNTDISVWPSTESHCGQQEVLTTDTDRNWLLEENNMSETDCANVKESEGIDDKRDITIWDQVQTSNTDSGDMFRRSDVDDNIHSDTSININHEVTAISEHTVDGTDVSNSNESCFETGNSNILETDSNSHKQGADT